MPSRTTSLLTALACLGFGCAALALGMDANWDLRNYHYYNGWRFLHGLEGRDILVAQTPSFYNPLMDAPYAWAVERLPAKAIGFALGALHGLNLGLLFAIARRLLAPAPAWAAALVALVGATGAGGLSELGTVFYDNVLSVGVLASVLMVVAWWERLDGWRALLAGVPVGVAFGLKQPVVIFCAGLALALLAGGRWRAALWFALGSAAGFAASGGFWALHLWRSTGNPLFPYFNHVFQSPWGLPQSYRDPAYLPASLWEALTLGLRYPFAPRVAGEALNVDFRILALLVLAPLAVLWRQGGGLAKPGQAAWLLGAALASYGLWVALFSIYRYVVALEMLAPLLVAALLVGVPLASRPARGALAGLVLAGLAVSTSPGTWLRVEWRERAIEAELPPIEPDAVVVLSGHEPLSFLVPLFPRSVRFVRIDSTFALPPGPTPFRSEMARVVEQARGPVYALHIASHAREVDDKLRPLDRMVAGCREFTSPIGVAGDPYRLCLTKRRSLTDEVAETGREATISPAATDGS